MHIAIIIRQYKKIPFLIVHRPRKKGAHKKEEKQLYPACSEAITKHTTTFSIAKKNILAALLLHVINLRSNADL
jgi:hypothetical protein